MVRKSELPPDVESEQVWCDSGGQHWKVHSITNGVAAMNRCTQAGRVLNQRYVEKVPCERMQAGWRLVSGS